MLEYLYHALSTFRKVFSRKATWLAFCAVVLGFIGATHIDGVSSFCRFWGMQTPGYMALLQLFNSTAWSLCEIMSCWQTFVLSQKETILVGGRAVQLGDHTVVAKDGRCMPGVVTLYQDSETQSKPSYFRGHFWASIGLLIGSLERPFCLPLISRIHQGFKHLGQNDPASADKITLASRLVQMAIDFAIEHNLPSYLILDAFFSTAPVFQLAASVWSVALKQPLVSIITRSKSNYVAYHPPQQPEGKKRGPGAPRKYGKKVNLAKTFDYADLFNTHSCKIYGEIEQVPLLALNLMWKPTKGLIRFVFALTRRGPIILMCSDLNIHPVTAIELYCTRVRIEGMFDMLKNLIHAFEYHFWSKHLPKHSRKPKKNKFLMQPALQGVKNVALCWEKYERFVMLASIALGLLQLLALKFSDSVWLQFNSFLRTRSRSIPSERTVKDVLSKMLVEDFYNLAPSATMQEIQNHFHQDKKIPIESEISTQKNAA